MQRKILVMFRSRIMQNSRRNIRMIMRMMIITLLIMASRTTANKAIKKRMPQTRKQRASLTACDCRWLLVFCCWSFCWLQWCCLFVEIWVRMTAAIPLQKLQQLQLQKILLSRKPMRIPMRTALCRCWLGKIMKIRQNNIRIGFDSK